MFKISIVTVNWYSKSLIEKLLNNLYQKAFCPEAIKVFLIDNTNGKDQEIKHLKSDFKFSIHKLDSGHLSSSKAHANALNFAMTLIDTKFSLVLDPDIYVFKKHWDQFCETYLNETNNIAIGIPYPRWKVGKYHDFISPQFSFFLTQKIVDLKIGWDPYPKSIILSIGKFILRQIGRMGFIVTRKNYTKYKIIRRFSLFIERLFGVFAPDTGWLIAKKAREKNLSAFLFNALLPYEIIDFSLTKRAVFFNLASNYELFVYNLEPFLVHRYGSASMFWRTKMGKDNDFWEKSIDEMENFYSKKVS